MVPPEIVKLPTILDALATPNLPAAFIVPPSMITVELALLLKPREFPELVPILYVPSVMRSVPPALSVGEPPRPTIVAFGLLSLKPPVPEIEYEVELNKGLPNVLDPARIKCNLKFLA